MTSIFIAESKTLIGGIEPVNFRKKQLAQVAVCDTVMAPRTRFSSTMPELETTLGSAKIISTLRAYQAAISEPQAVRIADYIGLLLRWNQKISLTTITSPQEILARHFGESLFGARVAGIEAGRLLDVGSGAGFPALPIAMAAPAIRATLLEPNLKKAAFLVEASRLMELGDRVRVIRTRLEELPLSEGDFDFVTSRAVRVTGKFLAKCNKLLTEAGKLVLWLGQEEMAAIKENPGWIWAEPALIPGSERRFILWGRPERVGRST